MTLNILILIQYLKHQGDASKKLLVGLVIHYITLSRDIPSRLVRPEGLQSYPINFEFFFLIQCI